MLASDSSTYLESLSDKLGNPDSVKQKHALKPKPPALIPGKRRQVAVGLTPPRLSISCRATALRNVAQGDTRYRPAAKIRQPDRSVSHAYGVSTGPLPLA